MGNKFSAYFWASIAAILGASNPAQAQGHSACQIETNIKISDSFGSRFVDDLDKFEQVKTAYLTKIDDHVRREEFDDVIDCVLELNTLNTPERLGTPGPPSNEAIDAALFAISNSNLTANRKVEVFAQLHRALDAEFGRDLLLGGIRDQSLAQFYRITLHLSQALIANEDYSKAARITYDAARRLADNGRSGADSQVRLWVTFLYLVDLKGNEFLAEGSSADDVFSQISPIIEQLLNDRRHSDVVRGEAVIWIVNGAFDLTKRGSERGKNLMALVPDVVRTASPDRYVLEEGFARYHTMRMFDQLNREGAVLSQSLWATEDQALRNSVESGTLRPNQYINRQLKIINDFIELTPGEGDFASYEAALNIGTNLRVWLSSEELPNQVRESVELRLSVVDARIERKRGSVTAERQAIERVIKTLDSSDYLKRAAQTDAYLREVRLVMVARLQELPTS